VQSNEGCQLFFRDFKDYSLAPQLFLFFLTARDIVFSILLATMFEYPFTQILINTILNCLMIAYLFVKKPFQNTFDFVQQLFFEFTGLIVNISVLVNAILDSGKYQTIQARNNLGKLVIVMNMIFNFVTAVFMFYSLGQLLYEFYQERKQKRANKLKSFDVKRRLRNSPPLETSEISLKRDQSFMQETVTSNNNHEALSFQQESFDLDLLTRPRRRINRNKPFGASYHQTRGFSPSIQTSQSRRITNIHPEYEKKH